MFAVLAFVLAGCGGSSSDDGVSFTPTDPNTVFQLYPSGYLTAGYQESFSLSGSDTSGDKFTGNYSVQSRVQSTFNGDPAVPVSVLFTLTNTQTNSFLSIAGDHYFSPTLSNYLGFEVTTSGVTTASATTVIIPATGKIGDFGNFGTYAMSDGTTEIFSWKISDAGSGNAYISILETVNDQSGVLESTSEERYLINQSGDRQSVRFKVFDTYSGVTMTLSGNKK